MLRYVVAHFIFETSDIKIKDFNRKKIYTHNITIKTGNSRNKNKTIYTIPI